MDGTVDKHIGVGDDSDELDEFTAILCFSYERDWFQGLLLKGKESLFGFVGEELSDTSIEQIEEESGGFHRCAFSAEDPPTMYKLSIEQFSTKERVDMQPIACTNGDNAKLDHPSHAFSFRTNSFFVDNKASLKAKALFPNLAGSTDLVCIGEAHFQTTKHFTAAS
eukprot:m.1807 g.1807  ORF g.1807 m.1807 type:complete len:166 (-) comp1631_c0_seq1:179-676(-)